MLTTRVVGVVLSCLVVSGAARADDRARSEDRPSTVRWSRGWTRVGALDYAGITAGIGATALVTFRLSPREQERFGGGVAFDDAVRGLLRIRSPAWRGRADSVSDVTWYATMLYPFVGDALIAAGIVHGNADVAWQLTVTNVAAYLLTGIVTRLGENLIGRRRPAVYACDGNTAGSCAKAGRTQSFPSGHTALAFTAAGLTCAHHENLPLLGGGAPDTAACGVTLGLAAITGVLRVMADRHWASDVAVGAGLGLVVGYGLPHLTRYAVGDDRWLDLPLMLMPSLDPDNVGAVVAGAF